MAMRSASLLLTLCPMATCFGQIGNGSFEDGLNGSLVGWQRTCSQIDTVADHAPGWGAWCARLPNENTQGGCWTDYLYQVLPGIQNGDPLTVSGWIKHQILFGAPAIGIGIHAAHIDQSGMIHLDQSATSTDTNWVYVQFDHAFTDLLPSDTAVLLLTGGYSQWTTFYGYGLFDGIEVSGLSSSIHGNRHEPPTAWVYPSPCADRLHVDRAGPYMILDVAGSTVLQGTIPHAGATIDCARLAPGAYQLIVGGGPQGRVARFVKD